MAQAKPWWRTWVGTPTLLRGRQLRGLEEGQRYVQVGEAQHVGPEVDLALVPPQHVQPEEELHVAALHDSDAAGQKLVAHLHGRLQGVDTSRVIWGGFHLTASPLQPQACDQAQSVEWLEESRVEML